MATRGLRLSTSTSRPFGSYTGAVDTYMTIEIMQGGSSFRWKRGPKLSVHGTTAGCDTASASPDCWSTAITIYADQINDLVDGVYVSFASASGWTHGDVFYIAAKAGTHHELSDGVMAVFGSKSGYAGPAAQGPGASTGDVWTIDVLHATPARGPLNGNTELTVEGSGFLPSGNLTCKLYDERTQLSQILTAQYDGPGRLRCVTGDHPADVLSDPEFYGLGQSGLSVGGLYTGDHTGDEYQGLNAASFEIVVESDTTFKWRENAGRATSGDSAFTTGVSFTTDWQDLADGVKVKFDAVDGYTATDSWIFNAVHITKGLHPTVEIGTIRPGVMKKVFVSNDGGITWSKEGTGLTTYLFSDIYASPEGDDSAGDGTAGNPYATLQRAIYAANGEPRAGFLYDSATTGEQWRGKPGVGLGAHINRDSIVAYDGHYFGSGNVGLYPLGKVVEVRSATSGGSVIDCRNSRMGAVHANSDKMMPGGAAATLGHIGLSGFVMDGCDQGEIGITYGSAAFGRKWG